MCGERIRLGDRMWLERHISLLLEPGSKFGVNVNGSAWNAHVKLVIGRKGMRKRSLAVELSRITEK